MREKEIEEYLDKRVTDEGGETRKLKYIYRRGAPDRLVLLKGAHFIELKAPGKKEDPHQKREHARMKAQGVKVWIIDLKIKVDNFIREILK